MKLLLLLLAGMITLSAFGQQTIKSDNKYAQKSFEQANQLLSNKQYERALELLQDAVNADNQFAAAYQQAGDIYRKLQQYPQAKANYLKVLVIDENFHPLTFFGLAESELYTGDYEAALNHFTKYAALPGLTESSKKLTAKYIADCKFSIDAVKNPVSYSPKNLGKGINTSADEYLPVVTADEENLIFTRRTNNNEDFFQSFKQQTKWNDATYLSNAINTSTYNEGSQCISPDGLYLFFTGCNRPDGMGRCDIYVSKKEGKEWSKPFNLGAPINTPGWESQPSISADGRTLFFVSARAGGLGGNDIWKTTLQTDGNWSAPQNLGPQINTTYDEHSPFIHPDGKTLYFASNGWPGLGKNDMYISKKDDKEHWSTAKNLGYPINTAGEESGLTISTNGLTAYFSSNIAGGAGNMDIYSFELPQLLRPEKVTYVKGEVIDALTKEPLDASIQITELKSNILTYDDVTSSESGEFLATMQAGKTYSLNVYKPGYLFHSENFNPNPENLVHKPYKLKIALHKITVGGVVTLNNIFFESNKSVLLPESKTELQQLINFLKSNPKISIEINGHTDNVGELKRNQILSENRAKAVYDYIILNSISTTRLKYKGLGETEPIAENSTENGRQQNRRTAFKITGL